MDSGQITEDVIVRFRCEGQQPSYAELKTQITTALST
jgi:hypothetical protein